MNVAAHPPTSLPQTLEEALELIRQGRGTTSLVGIDTVTLTARQRTQLARLGLPATVRDLLGAHTFREHVAHLSLVPRWASLPGAFVFAGGDLRALRADRMLKDIAGAHRFEQLAPELRAFHPDFGRQLSERMLAIRDLSKEGGAEMFADTLREAVGLVLSGDRRVWPKTDAERDPTDTASSPAR